MRANERFAQEQAIDLLPPDTITKILRSSHLVLYEPRGLPKRYSPYVLDISKYKGNNDPGSSTESTEISNRCDISHYISPQNVIFLQMGHHHKSKIKESRAKGSKYQEAVLPGRTIPKCSDGWLLFRSGLKLVFLWPRGVYPSSEYNNLCHPLFLASSK